MNTPTPPPAPTSTPGTSTPEIPTFEALERISARWEEERGTVRFVVLNWRERELACVSVGDHVSAEVRMLDLEQRWPAQMDDDAAFVGACAWAVEQLHEAGILERCAHYEGLLSMDLDQAVELRMMLLSDEWIQRWMLEDARMLAEVVEHRNAAGKEALANRERADELQKQVVEGEERLEEMGRNLAQTISQTTVGDKEKGAPLGFDGEQGPGSLAYG